MRRSALILTLWLGFLAVCAVIAAQSRYRTDMGDFLPHTNSLALRALEGQVNGGAAAHVLLIGITGAAAPALAELSNGLAAKLRHEKAFLDALNGAPASFGGVQNYVWTNRYLLSPKVTPAAFTAAGLRAALQRDLALLNSALGMALGQSLPSDPTGEALALQNRLAPSTAGPALRDGVWMSKDGGTALLIVHTRAPGFDIDAQARTQAMLRADFDAIRIATPGAAGARLEMSGPGVFAVQSRDTTRADVSRLSALALAGAAGLLLFAYRSPRMLLLGLLPILTGALAAIAAVSLRFGFVHGITLGFGVTLIGESLDYAIYLFTQTGRGEDARATLARIWPVLRLGAGTSMAGFCAMLFSSFTGFAQLGLFSIAGLAGAVLTTRLVLPLLMPAGFYAPGAELLARPVLALLRWRRAAGAVLGLALLAAIAALALHQGGMWDRNLLDLSPLTPAAQNLDAKLRGDLGISGQRYFAVFRAGSEQAALQRSEALTPHLQNLAASGALGGFDLPSEILPSAATQRARQAALPGGAVLRASFADAAHGLPFKVGAFAPFFAAVAAAKQAPLLTPSSLPPALALQYGTMLSRDGDGFVVMAPLDDVRDPGAVAAALRAAGADFVDLTAESDRLLAAFQHQATILAVAGSLGVFALLWLGLRRFGQALRVAAPLAMAVVLTAALLTAGGAKLTIFEVAGFMLIIAIGSNYGLFFAQGKPGAEDWPRRVASITLANLCTVAAYGLLSLSHIALLHDIGLTVAAGTLLCLLCGAVFSTRRAAR